MTEQNLAEKPSVEVAELPVSFDWSGLWEGIRQSLGVAAAVFSYGLVFGVLARQAGLSMAEALLMSSLVFAGASQITVLGLWAIPLPVLPIILTTLVVNLRHLLMGASLSRWFLQIPGWKRYLSLFFLTDESWALTMSQFNRGKRNGAFLLGSGFTIFAAWLGATGLGRLAGNVLQNPAKWGLDFAFLGIFLALLTGMYKGKTNLLPWLVAAAVALLASWWLPGKWYILLGGLAGSLTGAFSDDH